MLFTAIITQPLNLSAQDESYKYDVGVAGGVSGYLGDANESNLFHSPGWSVAMSGRYLFDRRWALRMQIGAQRISGNTADFDNVMPKNVSFDTTVADLTLRGEYNFFDYGIGPAYMKLRRISPYLSVGVGVAMTATDDTKVAFVVPMGVGVKYKLNSRTNISAELTMTKTFSDSMDGRELSDPYGVKSSALKNTDWYASLSMGISYEFGSRCATCNRID